MNNFGLSHENAENKNEWKLSVKGQTVNPGVPGKWT